MRARGGRSVERHDLAGAGRRGVEHGEGPDPGQRVARWHRHRPGPRSVGLDRSRLDHRPRRAPSDLDGRRPGGDLRTECGPAQAGHRALDGQHGRAVDRAARADRRRGGARPARRIATELDLDQPERLGRSELGGEERRHRARSRGRPRRRRRRPTRASAATAAMRRRRPRSCPGRPARRCARARLAPTARHSRSERSAADPPTVTTSTASPVASARRRPTSSAARSASDTSAQRSSPARDPLAGDDDHDRRNTTPWPPSGYDHDDRALLVAHEVARAALEALLVVEEDPSVGGRHEELGRAGDDAVAGGAVLAHARRRRRCGRRSCDVEVGRRRSRRRTCRTSVGRRSFIRTSSSRSTASRTRSRRRTPSRLRSVARMRRSPGFGRGLSTRNMRLDGVGDHRWVQVLDAIGEHELGRPAQLAVIAQHERGRQTCARSRASPAVETSPAASASIGRLAGGDAAGHGEVDTLEPDAGGEAQGRGVAGDEQPIARQLRHHRHAGLGDQVGGVLLDLAALDQRRDRRVGLELAMISSGTAAAGRRAPAA